MIKCRGERVSAKEVENILYEIPGIKEAAVIGIPDGIEGQSIKAFVIVNPTAGLDEKNIRKYCADHLEPFAVPRYIHFIDELPKTPNGKIDKKWLMEK
jgi:acyl-coenzyme A synthetase/AMP-(fatty) acid ligase